ncbi:MSCRAMM family protein [Geomonas sp.]|uniref:MSCRAMM family protein n=1 Tax=Geomonas sp. TaxID=2651584 RepID=UPI002B4A2793|nr:carboxypeptidase regulatory-like domain-containing protein [Geomonas sp.]HJV35703.1 carboxypeptidase regulatory-like domain-containing protein [Geomonas sp.]
MRKNVIYIVATLLLGGLMLVLAGCGGGGGGGATGTLPAAPAPFTITGKVSLNGAGLGQVSLAVTGQGAQFSDGNGNFSFTNLANGSYTVTPSRSGYTFTPASQTVTIANSGAQLTFTAAAIPSYTLSGKVSGSNGNGLSGATVSVVAAASGLTVGSQSTDGAGHYAIAGLADGSYLVSVSHGAGYSFTPAGQSVTVQGADQSANFSTAGAATYQVAGSVTVQGGAGLANVALSLAGDNGVSYRATSDASGNYLLSGIPEGYYTLTPNLSGYAFVPNPLLVRVNGADATGNAISASPQGSGSGSVTITL